MSTSASALIQIEQGRIFKDYAVMTDSSDHKTFTIATAPIYSGRSGYKPELRPNGIKTGHKLLTVHATNDTVNIGAFTAYAIGILKSVSATTDTITRPTGDKAKVNSITMTSAGAIAVIAGTDSADQTFVETRGAAGGPPHIPVDSVEIGQIRVTTETAAAITESEIFQIVGNHTERYDFPVFSINNIGSGDSADSAAEENAHVKFASALPLAHTGDVAKRVYLAYYEPQMADLAKAYDFKPAEQTHSVQSTQYYNGTTASAAAALGQGGFTALMDNNVTDALVAEKDQFLTVKFFPDRNQLPYILTQGFLGMQRSFPVDNQNQATVTITAEDPSAEFSS